MFVSHCRITGSARSMPPRTHYYPLLPPISPADARRLLKCQITGKSIGLPRHHYMPLLTQFERTKKSNKKDDKSRILNGNHKYVFPSIEEENSDFGYLVSPLDNINKYYTYDLEEEHCTLVVNSSMESAIQNGNVSEIFIASVEEGSVKVEKSKHVPIRLNEISSEEIATLTGLGHLLKGQGPNSDILKNRKRNHRKRKNNMSDRLKLFEEKEMLAEEAERKMTEKTVTASVEVAAKVRKKLSERVHAKKEKETHSQHTAHQNGVMKPAPEQRDYTYGYIIEKKADVTFIPEISLSVDDLHEAQRVIPGQLVQKSDGGQVIKFVPGQVIRTQEGTEFVPGHVINGKFIPGQTLITHEGPTFIPGQNLLTSEGPKFVPGQVVETEDGPKFVPGHLSVGPNGSIEFVPGKVIYTEQGLRFVADDLEVTSEGCWKFSVQGFDAEAKITDVTRIQLQQQDGKIPEITCTPAKEELKLNLPSAIGQWAVESHGQMQRAPEIDLERDVQQMFCKMAESGIPLGRQVSCTVLPPPDHFDQVLQDLVLATLMGTKGLQKEDKTMFQRLISIIRGEMNGGDVTKYQYLVNLIQQQTNAGESIGGRLLDEIRTAVQSSSEEHSEYSSPTPDSQTLVSSDSDDNTEVVKLSNELRTLIATLRGTDRNGDSEQMTQLVDRALEELASHRVTPEEVKLMFEELTDRVARQLYRTTSAVDETASPLKQPKKACVILKDDLQTIVPREAARALLTGEVGYICLTDEGIRYFDPFVTDNNRDAGRGDNRKAYVNGISAAHIRQSKDAYVVITDFTPLPGDDSAISVQAGQVVQVIRDRYSKTMSTSMGEEFDLNMDLNLLDNSAARHKLSVRPRRHHADSRQRSPSADTNNSVAENDRVWVRPYPTILNANPEEGYVPASILQPRAPTTERCVSGNKAKIQREAILKELLETEEEFVSAMQFIVDNYYRHLEDAGSISSTAETRQLAEHREAVFSNIKQIYEFHSSVLLNAIKYCTTEPEMLGKTFLRLERDFDKHVNYCRDENHSQELLRDNDELRQYMDEYSQQLSDDKTLSEHLKLPIQRINDYQLLFKELLKYTKRLGEDDTDLQRALELMLSVPQRANDLKFLHSIEGYRGNIHKLGRLLRHNWFTLTDSRGHSHERYLFLFKARILVCKVRRISDDRSVFVLKDIIRLPEVEVHEPEAGDTSLPEFSFQLFCPTHPRYPLTLEAHDQETKDQWLKEIRQYALDLVALAEHAADDLQIDATTEPDTEAHRGKSTDLETSIQIVDASLTNETAERTAGEVTDDAYIIEENRRIEKAGDQASIVSIEKQPQSEQNDAQEIKPRHSEFEKTKRVKVEAVVNGVHKVDEVVSSQIEVESGGDSEITQKEKQREAEELRKQQQLKEEELKKQQEAEQLRKQEEERIQKEKAEKEEQLRLKKQKEEEEKVRKEQEEEERARKQKEAEEKARKEQEEEERARKQKEEEEKARKQKEEEEKAKKQKEEEEKARKQKEEEEKARKQKEEEEKARKQKEEEEKARKQKAEEEKARKQKEEEEKARKQKEEEERARKQKEEAARLEEEQRKQKEAEEELARVEEELRQQKEAKAAAKKAKREQREAELKQQEEERLLKEKQEEERRKMEETYDGNPNRPQFTKTIEGSHCEVGASATFACVLKKRDDDIVVTWLRDNRPLCDKLADRVQITSEPDGTHFSLRLVNCRKEDSGLYTARATCTAGGVSSCSAHLVVQDEVSEEERRQRAEANRPAFVVKLKDTSLLLETFARFMIKVVGEPKPAVSFFKNGKPLSENKHVWVNRDLANIGTYELIIAGVTDGDAAEYSCEAVNEFGKEKCEGHVSVTDEKSLFKPLEGKSPVIQPGEEPDFTWTRDGQPFEPEERFRVHYKDEEDTLSLVFAHVTPEDAGLYTCLASTSSGKISCSAELTVQGAVHQLLKEPEKPSITAALADCEVSVGGSAMLELKLKGYPKPQVTWYRNGKEVVAGGKIRFLYEDEESIALIIKGVSEEDGGKYKVVAKNDLGEATTEATLFVRAPPRFKQKMKDMACMTDLPQKINVEVEGSPAPDVKWYKDGQLIIETERIKFVHESSEKFTLFIERVTVEDSGSYSVVATNALGQMSDFWTMVTHSPPKFGKELSKEVTRGEGESAVFEVSAQGNPKPTAQWFRNGEPLKADGKHIIFAEDGKGSFTLTIKDISRQDAGVISCKLVNEHGESTDEGRLRVMCAPLLHHKLSDMTITEGDTNVALTVEAEGHPKPRMRWFLNDVEITEKRKEFTVKEEGGVSKLVINEASAATSGKYMCRVTNDLGSADATANVTVNTKPKIVTPLKDIETDENQQVKLEAEIKATPEPNIKWFKDGKEVTADAHITIKKSATETYYLEFNLTLGEHTGRYEVVAENKIGKVTSAATLKVNSKPNISASKMEDREIWQAESTTFEVFAQTFPEPQVKWFKDNMEITKSTTNLQMSSEGFTHRLKVCDATLEETGSYKVVLANRLGTASKEAKLSIKELKERKQPKIVTAPESLIVKKGQPASFTAVVRGDPEPKVKWFRNDEIIGISQEVRMTSEPKDHSFNLLIENAHQQDTGVYTVKAMNEFGEAEAKANLKVLLKPEIEGMREVAVMPGGTAGFEVKVHAEPKAKVSWLRDNVEIKSSDHIQLTSAQDTTIGYITIHSLAVFEAQIADGGIYTVKAENEHGETLASARFDVRTEAPKFRTQVSDQKLRHRTPVSIKARLTGMPDPVLQWFKDGKPLVETDRLKINADVKLLSFEVTLDGLEEEDCGKYTAKAANVIGDAESSGMLEMIQNPPSIKSGFERHSHLDEGDILELKAKIDGSPVPQLTWFKDSKELNPEEFGDRLKIAYDLVSGEVKLTITDVKGSDAGAYRVIAKNKHGETQTLGHVDVKERQKRPQISELPKAQKVTAGQPLKLEAKVGGCPTPEIKWLKNGRPVRQSADGVQISLKPDGTCVLSLARARPEDAGKYTLVVSNNRGDAEADVDVVVEVKKAPMFLLPPQNQKVVEGTAVKLEAKLIGCPRPTISWSHNDEPVTSGSRVTPFESEEDDGSYIVGVCVAVASPDADAGLFTCTATNEEGTAKASATVNVTGKNLSGEESAPNFELPLRDVTGDEGSNLRIGTTLAGGNPLPAITWTRNGQPLLPGPRHLCTFDGKRIGLEIRNLTPEDEGVYSCNLTNKLGSSDSSAKVGVRSVLQLPRFSQPMHDIQQIPGSDVKFGVKVTGYPFPEISWLKNGKPLSLSDGRYQTRRDGDLFSLWIRDTKYDDSGDYICVARNSKGEERSQGRLDIVDKIQDKEKSEPPSFLKKIGDCEVFEGMVAKFTACVSGFPEPEFEWFKDGRPIAPSSRHIIEREGSGLLRLTIKNVQDSDVGSYRLRVFNRNGDASCEGKLYYDTLENASLRRPLGDAYNLYTRGAPAPLTDRPTIIAMSDTKLTLAWKPSVPSAPRLPVTYLVEWCTVPDGTWTTVRGGIRGLSCDVSGLTPFTDYKFRIRVENQHGISEPSPYAMTYRQRLEPEPPTLRTWLEPGATFLPDSSPCFPKDFDLDRPPHEGFGHAPRFLRQEYPVQYGVRDIQVSLIWFVYGYPKPNIKFLYDGKPIDLGGGKYDFSYTRSGQVSLFITRMVDGDVGEYTAVATNEHGEAQQRVFLEISEPPKFVTRLQETVALMRKGVRLEVQITGIPFPEVRWYKDWQPLGASNRVKMQIKEPDTCILTLSDIIGRDEGMYSIALRNVAGSTSCSAMVHVEESEQEYAFLTYSRSADVHAKPGRLFEDFYDIGDELGRGTQGVVYHAVERKTGNSFASKIMHGKGRLRAFMLDEIEAMNAMHHRNLIRLVDSFETMNKLSLITELAGGGELLDVLCHRRYLTESEVAYLIRQVLWGLEHMHARNYAHLGLTIRDVLYARPGSDEIKICDFGLARRIHLGKLAPLDYGQPEYVAPEVANGAGVGLAADMWSVGIITHILLTGISPFLGANDRETLTRIQQGTYTMEETWFTGLSAECRDFIRRLLIFQTDSRMDVREALRHPWLMYANRKIRDEFQISTDRLREYQEKLRDWYSNASCRLWYRRKPLCGAFTNPSKMVYPPGERDTPSASPEPKVNGYKTWEESLPERDELNYDLGVVKSESHYQQGPDTYLLQLRDVDFPVRLREYMKVASRRNPGLGIQLGVRSYDISLPIIRERRRFTDVMDEEIDDEKQQKVTTTYKVEGRGDVSIVREKSPSFYDTPEVLGFRRLRREVGTRPETRVEAEALLQAKKDGLAPFLREKPESVVGCSPGEELQLICLCAGDPEPTVQWFKGELVLTENKYTSITSEPDSSGIGGYRHILKYDSVHNFDLGSYRICARNKCGETTYRFRLVMGDVPSTPAPPSSATSKVDDTQILVRWQPVPASDDSGCMAVQCYHLQYKLTDETNWSDARDDICGDFYVVQGLQPNSAYHFRLCARNQFGWGPKSDPSEVIRTLEPGCPKVELSTAEKYLLNEINSGLKIVTAPVGNRLSGTDYGVETNPIQLQSTEEGISSRIRFVHEMHRGRFSAIARCARVEDGLAVAAKAIKMGDEGTEAGDSCRIEYETLRSLRHEGLNPLLASYKTRVSGGAIVLVYITEHLCGPDILSYLSARDTFTEGTVATVAKQVLEALNYIHWRGYAHLDIQPDNVVVSSTSRYGSLKVKLIDVGSAQRVTKLGNRVNKVGCLDYMSPEVASGESAFPQSDVWSLASLIYTLLSGVSPFRGTDPEETRQNVIFVRYRFEYLFSGLSQDATRFFMVLFKRAPSKRPSVEECLQHRWLMPNDFNNRRRERNVFYGEKLKNFSDIYHAERSTLAPTEYQYLLRALGAPQKDAPPPPAPATVEPPIESEE